MKVALIADIHSNMVALEAVLAEIERIQPDKVVCLGDVVSMGAQPRETLAAVRKLGCPVVMGNADDWVLNPKLDPDADEGNRKIQEMDQWNADQLAREDRALLASFVPTISIELGDGRELLAYHGSPKSYNDYIVSDTPLDTLDDLLGASAPLVCAGGHTHIQMVRRHRGSYVVNPGSVGMAYDPYPPEEGTEGAAWAEFAVMEVEGERVEVRLIRIPFDVRRWLAVLRESDLPNADLLLENYR